jgi:hypothetical protein
MKTVAVHVDVNDNTSRVEHFIVENISKCGALGGVTVTMA